MSTRYAYPPSVSYAPVIQIDNKASVDYQSNSVELENPIILTGTSTPTGIQETGSWITVSPIAVASDSDFEAYHGDNDEDANLDSSFEGLEEASRNKNIPRNPEAEEALRASLTALLADNVRPKFRKNREVRYHLVHEALAREKVAMNLDQQKDESKTKQRQHDKHLSDAQFTRSSAETLTTPLPTTHNMSSNNGTHPPINTPLELQSMTPQSHDKPQYIVERKVKLEQSPIPKSSISTLNSAQGKSSKRDDSKSEKIKGDKSRNSDKEGQLSSSKSKKRKPSKKSTQDTETGSSRNGKGVASSKESKNDDGTEPSPLSETRRKKASAQPNSEGHQPNSRNRNEGNNGDSRWYNGDITVTVWTAAVISGVLLGAGFGAGSIWRRGRGVQYTTVSA
ncbi:hypothetical protein G9A89_006826 [Geosiphon pyriformis]|nr:hypothetical protein G9A89_006826 [Geosiphon pyriformis]